jgi:hypothetical protein
MNFALTKEGKMSDLGFFSFCVGENYGARALGSSGALVIEQLDRPRG